MHIISMHSQKGGTGKTSIALSLAIAAQKNKHKTLLIDADLSGTSLRDSIQINPVGLDRSLHDFFRAPEAENPLKYIATANLTDLSTNEPHEISVLLGDAQTGSLLMPLVYKENHSQFLRSRIESLINAVAASGLADVIIFDNSPGDWGLSKAILEIVTADSLRDNGTIKINGKCILVSSLDLNDIVSCIHLREQEPKIPFLHIINRSTISGDINQNLNTIVDKLDQKGKIDPAYAGYITRGASLRQMGLTWVGTDEASWKGTYHTHVNGIHPHSNIDKLLTLLLADKEQKESKAA